MTSSILEKGRAYVSRLQARDRNLGIILLVLGAASALLLLLGSLWGPARPVRHVGPTSAQAHQQVSHAPVPRARGLPTAARRVAASWTTAFVAGDYRDRERDSVSELAPYSTRRLLREMSANSSAVSFTRAQRRARWRSVVDVQATQVQEESTVNRAVMVIYRETITTEQSRKSSIRTTTVALQRTPRGWRVGEVLVP